MSMGSRCQQGFHPILRQQPMCAPGVTMRVYTSYCCVSEAVFATVALRALGHSSTVDARFWLPPLPFFLLPLSPLQNFLEGAQRPRPPEDGAPVVIIWQRRTPASRGNSQLSADSLPCHLQRCVLSQLECSASTLGRRAAERSSAAAGTPGTYLPVASRSLFIRLTSYSEFGDSASFVGEGGPLTLVLIGESWYTVACTTGATSEAARAADVRGEESRPAAGRACDGWLAEVGAGVLTGVVE